jgi:hypothetical protein
MILDIISIAIHCIGIFSVTLLLVFCSVSSYQACAVWRFGFVYVVGVVLAIVLQVLVVGSVLPFYRSLNFHARQGRIIPSPSSQSSATEGVDPALPFSRSPSSPQSNHSAGELSQLAGDPRITFVSPLDNRRRPSTTAFQGRSTRAHHCQSGGIMLAIPVRSYHNPTLQLITSSPGTITMADDEGGEEEQKGKLDSFKHIMPQLGMPDIPATHRGRSSSVRPANGIALGSDGSAPSVTARQLPTLLDVELQRQLSDSPPWSTPPRPSQLAGYGYVLEPIPMRPRISYFEE